MDSDMAISSANTFRRIELITGAGRCGRSHEEAITSSVSQVARRHGMSPGLLSLWRRQARENCYTPRPLAKAALAAILMLVRHRR